jgi:hypothetical protein
MDRRHFPHEHWRGTGPCGFLITLLILSNLTALGFAGGDGISANIFYPALIADLLACVTGICGLQRERQAFFKPALLATTLTTAAMVPFPLYNDIAAARQLPGATIAAQQAIALLKAARPRDL